MGAFPNKFQGRCKDCGGYVAERAGLCQKLNGRWVVSHIDGYACQQARRQAAPAAPAAPVAPRTFVPYPDVPRGFYAIPAVAGDNDLGFYRVDRPKEGKYAGWVFLKQVIGGRAPEKVRGAENIRNILNAILGAGVDAARALYGQQLGRCGRCNLHLTDEESRRLGIGPECRKILRDQKVLARWDVKAAYADVLDKIEAAVDGPAGEPVFVATINQVAVESAKPRRQYDLFAMPSAPAIEDQNLDASTAVVL